MPPAFNLSHDQTLQFKLLKTPERVSKLVATLRRLTPSFARLNLQDSKTICLDRSAHTNCLIQILKERPPPTGGAAAHYTRPPTLVNRAGEPKSLNDSHPFVRFFFGRTASLANGGSVSLIQVTFRLPAPPRRGQNGVFRPGQRGRRRPGSGCGCPRPAHRRCARLPASPAGGPPRCWR